MVCVRNVISSLSTQESRLGSWDIHFHLSYRSRLYTCSLLCVGNRYVTACRYIARVVEVEQDKGEVLVHFERWNSRYDEYIKMSSKRLRVLLPERKAMLQRERDRQHSKVGGV